MTYHFYAMLSRMKNIFRWGLMQNTHRENLSEHSLEVAQIAHCLALLRNRRFGGNVDANAVATAAMFHDTSEILTGDLPTPIKYFNPEIRGAYKQIEAMADNQLLALLPEDLRGDFEPLYHPDAESAQLIKAADKLSALIKCVQELNAGNREFADAKATTERAIRAMHLPEADAFLEEFMDSFSLTLDEQRTVRTE